MTKDRDTTQAVYRIINHTSSAEVRDKLIELAKRGFEWDAHLRYKDSRTGNEFYFTGLPTGLVIVRIAKMVQPSQPRVTLSKTAGTSLSDFDFVVSSLQREGLELARVIG